MDQWFEWDDESSVASNAWEEQVLQLVMPHDGMAFFPIDGNPRHGLLVINHAHTDDGWLSIDGIRSRSVHGVSMIEIFERQGQWRVMPRSRYVRRIKVQHSVEAAREPSTSSRTGSLSKKPGGPGSFQIPINLYNSKGEKNERTTEPHFSAVTCHPAQGVASSPL